MLASQDAQSGSLHGLLYDAGRDGGGGLSVMSLIDGRAFYPGREKIRDIEAFPFILFEVREMMVDNCLLYNYIWDENKSGAMKRSSRPGLI
jgi:hypothetical protein